MKLLAKLSRLLTYEPNCENVVWLTVKYLKLRISHSTIRKKMEEHPDYPSLLAVSDVLTSFGVHTLAAMTNIEQLAVCSGPCIAQVNLNGSKYFALVKSVSKSAVCYIDPETNHTLSVSPRNFDKIFTGYLLFLDASEARAEENYPANIAIERRGSILRFGLLAILPILWLTWIINKEIQDNWSTIPLVILSFLLLCGSYVTSALLWYEVDKHNPVLRQVCNGSGNTNCGSVLSSTASSVFGIKWSVLGFAFFTGTFLFLVLGYSDSGSRFMLACGASIIPLPYVFYSVYYQARVIKKWCILCLTVQILIAAMSIITFLSLDISALRYLHNIETIVQLIIFYLIPFATAIFLLPLGQKEKERKKYKLELQKLKHNEQIFHSLLKEQKAVTAPDNLGIILGNPSARNKIIKVCNPYCGPCAKAHPDVEDILKINPDVQVQIIFTATGSETDRKTKPVLHMLSVAEKNDQLLTKKALDDWYMAKEKNMDEYAQKYPLTEQSDQRQLKQVSRMHQWCKDAEISATPTFFLGGFQLPDIYTITDLKYFLSV